MINSKIVNVDSKAFAMMNTLLTLIISIIIALLFLLFGGALFAVIPEFQSSFTDLTVGFSLFLLISVIAVIIIQYIYSFINAKLYNFLLEYVTGFQIELTPNNEVKEVDIVPTSIILSIMHTFWGLIISIIFALLYSVLMPILLNIGGSSTESTAILTSPIIPIIFIVLIVISAFIGTFINTLISTAIYNLIAKKYPVKLSIIQHGNLELKSIDIKSFVIGVGLTTIIIQVIYYILQILMSLDSNIMGVYALSLIFTIIFIFVFLAILAALYNFIASKKSGYQFDIVYSDNIRPINNIPQNNQEVIENKASTNEQINDFEPQKSSDGKQDDNISYSEETELFEDDLDK